ncbi:MAG: hypothetical protein ACFE96_09955 [Candidatus Hermodarchaeota archaeon]
MNKRTGIIIIILLHLLTIGQFLFLISVQSREVWRFEGVGSGTSGELAFNLPWNPFYSEYLIEASEDFTQIYSVKEGSVRFYHISSNQSFFFEYSLFESGYYSTSSERRTWRLLPGWYTIIWTNNDSTPCYTLLGMSFLYPMDEMYLFLSGSVVVIMSLALINPTIKISKKYGTDKARRAHP